MAGGVEIAPIGERLDGGRRRRSGRDRRRARRAASHRLAARRDPAGRRRAAGGPARPAAGRAVGPAVARRRRRRRPRGAPRLSSPGGWPSCRCSVRGRVAFATAELLHPIQLEELRAAAGHADLVVTTPQRVLELTTAAYREPGIARATDHLRVHRPEASASRVLTRGQKLGGGVVLAVLAAAAAVWPLGTATVVLAVATTYYLLNSLYKFKLAFDSLSGAGTIDVSDEEVAAVDERTLPRYTVLVPLYKEAGVVGLLTHNLSRLDYPAAKLEVLLLCEEDDDDDDRRDRRRPTCRTYYHLILVPEVAAADQAARLQLRAPARAAASSCVIYDAEDQPDPDQLKKVVLAFCEDAREPRLRPGQAQLLQPPPEPAHALVRRRVRDLVRPRAPRPGLQPASDPARRHVEPLPDRRPARARRLGPVQRDRGRRPRDPPLAARLRGRRWSTR